MTLALPVDLAERIKDLLNANSGATINGIGVGGAAAALPAIEASRTYIPRYKLEQLEAFKVTVVPRGDDEERSTKGGMWQHGLVVDVGFQKLLLPEQEEDAQLDVLTYDVQLIKKFLQQTPILRAVVLEATWDPLYDEDSLEQHSCFTSVLRLTYRYTN